MTKRAVVHGEFLGVFRRVVGFSPESCWSFITVFGCALRESLVVLFESRCSAFVERRAKEWSTWRAAEPEEARERRDSAGRAEDWRDRTGSAGEGSPTNEREVATPFLFFHWGFV